MGTSRFLNYWSLLGSAVVVFILLAVVFSVTGEKQVSSGHPAIVYDYGGTRVTLLGQGAADLFEIKDGPGVYVRTEDGQVRRAVPYGLLLAAQGLAAGRGWQVTIGLNAFAAGMVRSRTGLAGLVLLVLVIAGVAVIRHARKKARKPASGMAAAA